MRVFAASCHHETHSFSSMPTTIAQFKERVFISGQEAIRSAYSGSETEWGGVLQAATDNSWDLICGLAAEAEPAGIVTDEAFEIIAGSIVGECRNARPLDGVVLMLHGSMISHSFGDTEGELLSRLRQAIGPHIPIAITLDLHANVTELMVRHADVITSYRTTPHLDQKETATRACELLQLMMNLRIRPSMYLRRPPTITGLDLGRTLDRNGPMPYVLDIARHYMECTPGILDISVHAGYPYADVVEAGPSVVVVTDGAHESANEIAEHLCGEIWRTRLEQTIKFTSLSALPAILRGAENRAAAGPLILADYSDGPGGGGYGDGTNLLRLLIELQLKSVILGPLFDPNVAKLAWEKGLGARLNVQLGGNTDPRFGGGPLKVEAVVKRLSDGRYRRKGPYGHGTIGELGPSALIGIKDLDVIVTTFRIQAEDREQIRIFGVNPEDVKILACKGINHFRADFEPIASDIIYVDSGGIVSPDLKIFPFHRVRRPVWPLDDINSPP